MFGWFRRKRKQRTSYSSSSPSSSPNDDWITNPLLSPIHPLNPLHMFDDSPKKPNTDDNKNDTPTDTQDSNKPVETTHHHTQSTVDTTHHHHNPYVDPSPSISIDTSSTSSGVC